MTGWTGALACALAVLALPTGPASAETLLDALSSAYQYNPRLDAERARLRATDETVAQAMSGYRPRVDFQADVNMVDTKTTPSPDPPGGSEGTMHPYGYRFDATQPLFRGGQTYFQVSETEANVRAGRETLRDVEQQVLLEAVTAYMDVLRDQAIVRLRENNVTVLSKELKATQDRFAVGEVTKTDVAQAQARRAGAVSQLDLAKADLKGSRARFEQVIGHPPSELIEPTEFNAGLPNSLNDAKGVGTHGHPRVVAALYREQSARHAVDRIRGQLLPQLQLEASFADRFDPTRRVDEVETTTVTGRLNMPIYEGGEIYSQVRQAKHTHISTIQEIEQERAAIEAEVVTRWSQLMAVRAQLESDNAQVTANSTALAGVREEERVGQRTLLDVLNAEQELLDSQVQLATTKRNLVVAAYALRSAIGQLDVATVGAASTVYDPTIHHQEVRRKWIGTRITDEDPWNTEVFHEPVK
jgi:outer membrane protein